MKLLMKLLQRDQVGGFNGILRSIRKNDERRTCAAGR